MFEPKILFRGSYQPSQITITESPYSNRQIDEGIENEAKNKWLQIESTAKLQGKKVWDSHLYRLDDYSVLQDTIHLTLSSITFSTVKAMMKMLPEIESLGEDYFPKSIFTNAIIKTADDRYILGRNSGITLNTHDVELIGGVASKSELIITTGKDLFAAIEKELEEEINITTDKISFSTCIGCAITQKLKVLLVFSINLYVDSDEVNRLFLQKNDGEISGLLFLTREEFIKTLRGLDERQQLIANEFVE